MKISLFVWLVALIGADLCRTASATELTRPDMSATTQQRRFEQQSRIDYATALIRSTEDLNRFLESPQFASSPLAEMSAAGRERFLNSVRFNEKGLTSFEYADLETELTPTQIYRVLKLFGAEHSTSLLSRTRVDSDDDAIIMNMLPSPIDYRDFECAKRATCSPANFNICTGNC